MAEEDLTPPEQTPQAPADPTFEGFDPSLGERFVRNASESFRGGTLVGGAITLSQKAESTDTDATQEERDRAKALLQDRQVNAAVYETMRGWDSPLEAGAALGGQFAGSLLTPENAINKIPGITSIVGPVLGRFGEAATRIGEFALSQGVVNAATDPVLQAVDINANIRTEYSFAQTALSFGLGTIMGGVFGSIGEMPRLYEQYRRTAPGKPAQPEPPKPDTVIAREDVARAAGEDPSLVSEDIRPTPRQEGEVKADAPAADAAPAPRVVAPEEIARQQAPDLFTRIDDLETRIEQARAALEENQRAQQAQPPALADQRIAALEEELGQITGKRRSPPRAQALREEIGRLQGETAGVIEGDAGRLVSDEQMLRLRLNDLQQQRAALGPEYRAAMERAQQSIAEQPKAPEAAQATQAPQPAPEAAPAAPRAAEPAATAPAAGEAPRAPGEAAPSGNVVPMPHRPAAPAPAQQVERIAARIAEGKATPVQTVAEVRAAVAAARKAAEAAPQTPAVQNRLRLIDQIEREIAAASGVGRADDVEAAVRTSFGKGGSRLADEGRVKVVQSVADLPARPDGQPHPDDVKGLFDGKTAYLVADNLTPGEARGVLLHEIGVHAGMREMLGPDLFAKVLDEVEAKAKAGEGPFAAAARAVPEDTPVAHRAEEMLAYLVEDAPELPVVQRILAAVRQWVYRVTGGRLVDLTEADLREMAVAALRQWEGEPGPGGIVYSRGSSVDLRSGNEDLRKYGLDPGGRYNTRDIAAAMEARQREKVGTVARDDFSDATAKKIGKWMAEEVKFAHDQQAHGSDAGVGWYSEKYQRALDQFGEVFPELKTDKTKRDFFTALVAIMSDGQKVHNNFVYAARMYEIHRHGKPLPVDVTFGGERSTSMRTNLRAINDLLAQYGEEGMAKFLMQEFTVSQLAKMAKETGVTFSTSYKASQTLPMAALVFGPKLGAFYSNLMGSHGYLTMDRWWSRTFNRYRGQLLARVIGTADAPFNAKGEPIGLARFKQMLGEPGISDAEALTRLADFRDAYEAKGYKNGTDIEKAANTLYKDAFVNLEDQPFNASDREFMIKAANEAQKALKKQGIDLSIADIQAVLWYYEKRLYGELGARQSADVSYEEAAARVVRESKGAGPERWVAQDNGGDAIPGPDGSLVEVGGDVQQRSGKAAARAVEEANVAGVGDAIKAGEATVVSADEPVTFRYSRGAKKEDAATITVWHGSPHDFDRFDISRIGTGEGAQAYGRGLYFAENQGVAKGYRDGLTKGNGNFTIGGRPISSVYDRIMRQADSLPPDRAQPLYERLQILDDLMNGGDVLHVRELADDGSYSPDAVAWFEKEVAPTFSREGRLYEVSIKADPEHFLDWDKPLSEQPHVQNVMPKLGFEPAKWPYSGWVGDKLVGPSDYPETLLRSLGPKGQGEQKLREAGIPGIKYLDAGSRGVGDGTRNYVVFDDSLVEIVNKYSRRRAAPDNELIAQRIADLKSQIEGLDQETGGTQGGMQFRQRQATPGGAPQGPPPAGQTAAAAGASPPAEVVSLHGQTLALAEALDLPMFQGRVNGGKTTLGQFDPRQGVARVRSIADFATAAHEAGHAVEQKVGAPLAGLIQASRAELGPLDYDTTRMDPREGFAMWVEGWLTNPAWGAQHAPRFAADFERVMGDNAPAILKALKDAQAAHTAWLNAPVGEKVGAIVQTQTPDTALKTLRENGMAKTVSMVIGKFSDWLFDDKGAVTEAVRALARMTRDASGTRLSLEGADNPEHLVRLFGRNAQAAVRDMLDGVRGYRQVIASGPSLRDAIIMATGQKGLLGSWNTDSVKAFSDYLVLRRAAALYEKFDAGQLQNRPLAMSKADVLAGIAEAEAANPNLAAAGQMVHDYTRALLRKMFDAGLIDAELYGKLAQEQFYVPMFRDMRDKPAAGGAMTSSPEGPGMTDLVKRMRGSDRDIIDPLQSLMTQTFLVNRTVQHNDIIRSFVGLARKAQAMGAKGTGAILEEIPARQLMGQKFDLQEVLKAAAKQRGIDPVDAEVLAYSVADVFGPDPILGTVFRAETAKRNGEPIVFYKEGGQLRAVRFTSKAEGMALYEQLTELPPHVHDIALTLGQASATALRAGVTTNPVFAVTNFIRDQVAATILRPNYIPFNPKGVISEVRQDNWAQLYAYAGGVSPGAGAQGLHDMVDQSINALARKGWVVQKMGGLADLVKGQGIQRVTGPMKAVAEVVEVSEAGTRHNVFKKVYEQKIAQGLSQYDAMIEAAAQATDLMDFGRHGSGTLYIRKLVPFLNAQLQGVNKAWRTLVTPVGRALAGELLTKQDEAALVNAGLAWFKMAGIGGALGYMYSLWAQGHRAYQDANEELRATHLIIPGGAFGMDGKVIVIPKPFELAIGFNLGEMLGLKVGAGDPRWAEFAKAGAWEVVAPANVLESIPIVKTWAELKLNRSFFTGRDIVPERLQGLKPEEQYTDKTSSLAKSVGRAIGVSPVKVDYAIGSAFSLWGRDLLALSNTADPNAAAASDYDKMFARRFIKSADSSSETTKRFWDQAASRNGQLAKAKQTYEDRLAAFQDEDAMRFLGALPRQEKAFVILNSAADEDGKAAFKTEERRLHPLTRAAEASTTINGMIRELSRNAQVAYESGQRINLNPDQRRDVIENLRQLAAMEQFNALVILKDKGYEGRRLEDTAKQLEVIRAHSPEAAQEVATRYATAKIYQGKAVAKTWPEVERRLLADGGKADIRDLAYDVQAEGWEFGGERVRKPTKRRIEIPASVLSPVP